MKILLIKPYIKYEARGNEVPPLGLAYIAAVLEEAGHNVKILDRLTLKQSDYEFEIFLKTYNPDIIGFTCMTPEYSAAINNLHFTKKILPDSIIIFGGVHPTLFPEDMLTKHPEIDFIVIGEGEYTITDLINNIKNKNNSFKNIKGIAYRNENGKIIITPAISLIKDINDLPMPAYHLLPMDRYKFSHPKFNNKKYMMMIISRGCPYKCSFCAHPIFGRKVRLKSIKKIIQEIDLLYYKFKVKAITFIDDTFIVNSKLIHQLCNELINRRYDLIWSCVTNLHTVQGELLKKMKQAGCIRISYGVESADPIVLEKINKPRKSGLVEEVFYLTEKARIESFAYFMIGMPGETKNTLLLNRKLIKKIKPDYLQVTILCPMPGSIIYQKYKEQLPTDWERYQMAITKKKPLLQLGDLNSDELLKEVKSIYRWFYLNPFFIMKRIVKDIRSIKDLLFFIKKALIMFKHWF